MYKVSKVKYQSNIKREVLKAVDLIGGFSKFVKKGDVVLLKPNFNTKDPYPASTSPDFLKAAIELIYEVGAKLVVLGESSTMTLNTKKVMGELGIFNLLNDMRQPPKIVSFEDGEWIKKEISEKGYLKSASLPKIIEKADKIIFLPCLKTHKNARYTGALKLSVGFMKPSERVWLHMKNIEEKIADLNLVIKPDLIIMDARQIFTTGGPQAGLIESPGLIMASDDRVAIDIEGIKIIQSYHEKNLLSGFDPWDLPTIKRAVEIKIGAENEKEYEIKTP